MADQLQLRGGTTAEHATFTGALREVTVDTDKDTVVVHDNATAGGHPLLREDLSNLPAGTIDNADISASAAIAYSKLAALTAGNVVLGNGSNVATSTAVTGDVTINSSGVTAIGSGVIVDADVSASAAIAGTKVAPDFGSQNLVTTGTATAASLNPTGSSVPTNGVYLPAANSVAISTNSVERVKLGTSEVVFNDGGNDIDFRIEGDTNANLFFVDASADAVGIGTTSASSLLTLRSTAADNTAGISMQGASAGNITNLYNTLTDFVVQHAASEAFRVDGSRRLLVGTSTARAVYGSAAANIAATFERGNGYNAIAVIGNTNTVDGAYISLLKSRGTTTGSTTIVASGDYLGAITFEGTDGTNPIAAAQIDCRVDGTPGANDMPGRLVFSTTADGASSPTERMRITASGRIGFLCNPDATWPVVVSASGANGSVVGTDGSLGITTNGTTCAYINRNNADGDLIRFHEGGNLEGAISVSGSTVTYGGGHLARWSQLPNDENPSNLLKGTVMSNLDEMCEWGEEDNEQLNKTKVSDIEGDPNVAGVFVSTSPSDEGLLDFWLAMTGDMIIRIAEGITVQRGDLLMSAGDGTAKPQDDDIIRSKTIAKVTSTYVTCTYDDGSYCVPCVLMAC